jgi:hypothetical protein
VGCGGGKVRISERLDLWPSTVWYGNDVLELGSEPFDSIDLLGEALFVSLVLLTAEALNFEFDSAEREVLEEVREPP